MTIQNDLATSPTSNNDGPFPIRTVASITGVNPVTLRAWERRYKLIVPQRTPKGHRLYSGDDIELIEKILGLLDDGISIGQVKGILGKTDTPDLGTDESAPRDVWDTYRQKMLQAIEQFDESLLDATYNDALSLYPIDLVNSRLTAPLLRNFGERWKDDTPIVAQEHFFSFYLRNKLGARVHHLNQRNTGPRLLLACLPGEFHEIGMLFFALAAVTRGFRILSLGANTPLELIPGVLEQQHCEAVVLSGSARPARGVFRDALQALVDKAGVPVFIGGSVSKRHADTIKEAGAIPTGKDIQPALQQITETLAPAA